MSKIFCVFKSLSTSDLDYMMRCDSQKSQTIDTLQSNTAGLWESAPCGASGVFSPSWASSLRDQPSAVQKRSVRFCVQPEDSKTVCCPNSLFHCTHCLPLPWGSPLRGPLKRSKLAPGQFVAWDCPARAIDRQDDIKQKAHSNE